MDSVHHTVWGRLHRTTTRHGFRGRLPFAGLARRWGGPLGSGDLSMDVLGSSARLLFRVALAIFTVTIVIGILNGMNLWEPSHNLLLTHVHAGTLGWITLAVIGAAMLLLGDGADERAQQGARRVAGVAIVVPALYVLAFATTTGIVRPIAGTLMLVAIVWVLAWAKGRYAASAKTTAQLGLFLALVSLTIGAVLGVLLGLFIARGSIPGLSPDTAIAIASAHPPAMLVGYLILAGAAVTHWLLGGSQARAGRLVMWALFTAGILANLAFILEIEPLIQLATLLEVVAIVTFIVHLRSQLVPSAWAGGAAENHGRLAVIFLAVGIGLLVYVVQLFTSGQLDPATGQGPIGVLLAFDHAMFIGVMTNALFALVARTAGLRADPVILWGVNAGLVTFLAGLVTDVEVLKQIGAPVMGLLLLYAIVRFSVQLGRREPAPTA
jgi:hypothetical protein